MSAAKQIKAPRGTQDVVPSESYKWHFVERIVSTIARQYGFKEIRFPTFEHTELFNRSVGDTTDIVQKEMYTFVDKGDRSITLRPEGTASTVRCALERGLLGGALPLKAYYITPCFRYEKPQAGRLREFHQFGVELFGTPHPAADAQVIALAKEIFDTLHIDNITLEINSIGCPTCRATYYEKLKEYFAAYQETLCETCLSRLDKNPLRILDCKNAACQEIAKGAPHIIDYLCDECKEHFAGVKQHLDTMGISYTVNPTIVRGLDYYTKTVFEFICNDIGAQGTVCGGGRYDGLVESLGGQHTPSLGFGMGLERLLLTLENRGVEIPEEKSCDIFIASMGADASLRAFALSHDLRKEGFYAESDIVGRSLKAQMKYANKLGAKFSMVIGESELESGQAQLKNMATGEATPISIGDDFVRTFSDRAMSAAVNDLTAYFESTVQNKEEVKPC